MYESGLGVPVDLARARELYEASALRGEFFGCIFLARLYASGKAGPKDLSAAASWYQKAIEMDVVEGPELEEARAFLATTPDAAEQ